MQAKLQAEQFEQLIGVHGRPVLWYEANICSCIDNGQPMYECKACRGKGYVYEEAIPAKALVSSITLNKAYQDSAGLFEVGDAIMTVPRNTVAATDIFSTQGNQVNEMYHIGMNDKVVLADDEYKSSEVLIRGSAMYGRPADTLINEVVTYVRRVRQYSYSDGSFIEYREGTDYRVDKNRIDWLNEPGAVQPAQGTQYSVVYYHRPTYIVSATLPKPRHQDGQELPRYVVLKYLHGGIQP